ncbi:MAG: dihydrolipoyl dehydrogenase [Acidobacteria bacterium]|nr:dihydrolipoyl dehydrogenase [Acidobacteriota bacterium]
MSDVIDVVIPDIGDVDGVEISELLVAAGDRVAAEQSLITLESDKASMEIPAPAAGVIREIKVAVGDMVNEGHVIATLEIEAAASEAAPEATPTESGTEAKTATPLPPPPVDSGADTTTSPHSATSTDVPELSALPAADHVCDVVVIGAGPGGYTAAFRAADLGLKVVLVERDSRLGGVCLNVGCIPSKAMLHAAAILDEAEEFSSRGITFGKPKIDLPRLNEWKDGVVGRLTKGLGALAKTRKVEVIHGSAAFTAAHTLAVESNADDPVSVSFRHAIIAVGSRPVQLPGLPDDERIWTSNEAIQVKRVPRRLLVVGGGIIGLEMAQIYSSLGSAVSVVELLDGIMAGADRDLVRPLERRLNRRYETIRTKTKVTEIKALKKALKVTFEDAKGTDTAEFDAVLVAVGRAPNGAAVAAENAGVAVSDRGFIAVDDQQRTNVAHIFAIGDVVGQPMLAHKATHEGKVAAEVCAGQPSHFDARVIPSVAYTDPEVAWVGITEEEAKAQELDIEVGRIPWAASGRALGMGRTDGLTKAIFDKKTERLIGVGIVGPHAGDLVGEAALAIEMGAMPADVGLTIHAHPTLSETLAFAAEAVEGTITDLYMPKKG